MVVVKGVWVECWTEDGLGEEGELGSEFMVIFIHRLVCSMRLMNFASGRIFFSGID